MSESSRREGERSSTNDDSYDSRLPTPDSTAAFRARLENGDYRDLFGDQLAEVMAQAAAEAGVADELGALRVVMARLLAEEDDLEVLATLIARIASVSVQAARAQRAISGQLAEGMTDAITTILLELERSES
jgi:hypothetical protein